MEATPIVASTRGQLRAELNAALGPRSAASATVALVPTMGALHAGHAALFEEARRRTDVVVASIFVNPLQFGPAEDLSRYPRTPAHDLALCSQHGVDLVFCPSIEEMYPRGDADITVDPGPIGDVLEGAARPGHFRGVLTVVTKLLNLVRPDVAVFGEKDYQQLVLVRRLVNDLFLSVDVVGAPTVRDPDGLALSSRNRYLSPEQRTAALAVSRALRAGQAAGAAGRAAILAAANAVLGGEPAMDVEYLALRSTDLTTDAAAGEARLLIAAKVGTTRLIDNLAVTLG